MATDIAIAQLHHLSEYHCYMTDLEKLQALINDHFGGNQAEFARAVGRQPAQINQYLKGRRTIGIAFKANVEERLKLPYYFRALRPEELPSDLDDLLDDYRVSKEDSAPSLPSLPSLQPILAWDHPDDLPEGEFVMVPKLDVKLSAGNGHEQLEINLTRSPPLAFRASWVREKRLKPGKLAAMTATGDSMQPGIFDGDSLVVDTSQTEVQDGKVYALWYDGGERVKRLYRLPGGGLRIKSDNPDHPPIEVQPEKLEHVRILGRVVHRSGDGGL